MAGGGSLKHYNHEGRSRWQDAPTILAQIGLERGDTMADIGAGDGYFSIPAAKIVGNSGSILALDAYPEAISDLNTAASAAGLTNIKTTLGEAERTILCTGCADVILMANVLHDFNDPFAALKNASIMLKPGGRLVDLDWKKESGQPFGPPFAIRFDQEKAAALLEKAGFKVISSELVGPYHYLLIAKLA
jgi:ubiquinone/menaquinone biosynthesis C-methylase UbiE